MAPAKILVVDDDILLLKLIEELLRDLYAVSLAKSGPLALRYLEKSELPDLILLDVDMPDMDGFETLLRFRGLDAERRVPVIYLTGLSDAESEVRGLALGAMDYIRKPVVRDVLRARIALRLEQAGTRRELELLLSHQKDLGGLDPGRLLEMEQRLTRTEFAVATMLAQGYTNEEIGRTLNYSPAYVKKVVSRIFDRLDICKRSEVKGFFT